MSCSGIDHGGKAYTTTDRALIMECANSTWRSFFPIQTEFACKHLVGLGENCSSFIPPPGTVMEATADSAVKRLFCPNGESWLSQAPFQIAQCINGTWIPPFDVCSDTGDLPRDCSFMAEKEISLANIANIAWSGDWRDGILEVRCDMSPLMNETGWTLAMAYEVGVFSEVEFYDGSIEPTRLFLGVRPLAALTTFRPYTFRFRVKGIDNSEYSTIYGSVIIDNATYSITQLGGVHGNGGDPISQHLAQPLSCSPTLCWWASTETDATKQVSLPSGFHWPTVGSVGMPPLSIQLHIRPEAFDLAYNCPPYLVSSPSWENHTSISVTEKRYAGLELSFECLGPLAHEIMDDGTELRNGSSTCSLIGGVLDWTRRLALPCRVKPIPPFVVSNQLDRYYYFSTSPASSFFEASDRCNAMDSSLATIDYIDNFNNSLPGTIYYVAHNFRMSDVIEPPVPLDSPCFKKNFCRKKDDTQCIVFHDLGEHIAESCYESTCHYICMIPGHCPAGFTEVRGRCFKVLAFVGSPLQTYIACNAEYSGLMTPYNSTIIYALLQKGVIERNVVYSTAIHTWANGLDNLDPSFAGQLPVSSDDQWFHFSIGDDDKISFISSPLDGDVLGTALCQYPADDKCLTDPESSLDNMSLSWDDDVNDEAIYTCHYGSFVGGNTSLRVQTARCIGQLGEWYYYDSLEGCIYVEVCLELPSLPSEFITNSSDSALRYLDNSIVFHCPRNMTTLSGLSEQTSTCTSNNATEYGYVPSVIEDCTVCLGEPIVSNGTLALGAGPYTVGTNVTATCDTYNLFAVNVTQMDLECTPEGWENASCYEGCIDPPPLAGANMIGEENTVASVGATLLYNCTVADLYIQTPSGPAVSLQVTCDADHLWTPNNLVMDCVEVCAADPLLTNMPVNSSWDGVARAVGTQVYYTCPPDHLLANRELNASITCEADKTWTYINETILECFQIVPVLPPLPSGNYSIEENITPYLVNQTLTFVCPEGQLTKTGNNKTSITATTTGWTTLDPEFFCMDVCAKDPSIPGIASNISSSWDELDKTVGAVVEYTCPVDYLFPDKSENLSTTCMEDLEWTNTHEAIFICREVVNVEPDVVLDDTLKESNMTITGNEKPYIVGQVVTFHCPKGQFSPAGTNKTEVIAISGGWTKLDENFICLDAIETPPPPGYNLILEPQRDVYVPGNQVNYTCIEGYVSVIDTHYITLTATAEGWEPNYPSLYFFCIDYSWEDIFHWLL
ncbi:uncharacterized protein [Palaemon carinicauda]|uniref:uncharacterized protein n=1 Tax=Palaemon carinicauda TaxID=392227 RepID=UPI0035B6063B